MSTSGGSLVGGELAYALLLKGSKSLPAMDDEVPFVGKSMASSFPVKSERGVDTERSLEDDFDGVIALELLLDALPFVPLSFSIGDAFAEADAFGGFDDAEPD